MAKTITAINPWSKVAVEVPLDRISIDHVYNLMSDDERYACEGQGDDDAGWVEFVAQHLGPDRMGVIVFS